jgi:hypothetical protein
MYPSFPRRLPRHHWPLQQQLYAIKNTNNNINQTFCCNKKEEKKIEKE